MVAFDCVPSNLQKVYWKFTRNDIRVKLRLYLGERQAHILQDYQSLALIVSQALGGSKAKGGRSSSEDKEVPRTKQEMEAAFKSVFG